MSIKESSNLIDILFIGHTTKDEITINSETQKIPGGGVYFGSMSAGYCSQSQNLETKLTVLTIGNPSDLTEINNECEKAKVSLHILPDSHTTTFCHSFIDNDPDKRVSTVPNIARSFTFEDIKDYKSKFTYVNPLFFGEVPPSLFKDLKERTEMLSVDSQGLLRNLIEEKLILKPPEELKEIFESVDILKVDLGEAKVLTGKEDFNSKQTLDYMWEIIPDLSLPIYKKDNELSSKMEFIPRDDNNINQICNNEKSCQLKILYDSPKVEKFLVKNKPYQQLSDHFGLSIQLTINENS